MTTDLSRINAAILACADCKKRGRLGPCAVHGPMRLAAIEAMPLAPVTGVGARIGESQKKSYGVGGQPFSLTKRGE